MAKENECWICHRKLSEVIEAGNKMGYEPISCPDNPKEIEKNAMSNIDVLGRKVAICAICHDIIFEVARDNLMDALNNGTGDYRDDIVTYKDMENATLEVHLGEAPIHKSKLANRNPKGEKANNQAKKGESC